MPPIPLPSKRNLEKDPPPAEIKKPPEDSVETELEKLAEQKIELAATSTRSRANVGLENLEGRTNPEIEMAKELASIDLLKDPEKDPTERSKHYKLAAKIELMMSAVIFRNPQLAEMLTGKSSDGKPYATFGGVVDLLNTERTKAELTGLTETEAMKKLGEIKNGQTLAGSQYFINRIWQGTREQVRKMAQGMSAISTLSP